MSIEKIYLSRDGQSQRQRFPAELDPLFAKIDNRNLKDMLDFTSNYAKELNFFDTATNKVNGNWYPFFDREPDEIISKLKESLIYNSYGGCEPHLALYLTFLLLFQHAQNYINGITKRHLDFYYKEILKFTNKEPIPDKVHLIFELKKNVPSQLVKAETLFKAGKDQKGIELFYALTRDIVVNKARVESLRSLFIDNGVVHIAPVANSSDGLGRDLDKNDPKWKAFGHQDLPLAEIGFALASPMLRLHEGKRTITIEMTFSQGEKDIDLIKNQLSSIFNVYLTGEKGWIGPKNVAVNKENMKLIFTVELTADEDPVIHYNQKIHGGTFNTNFPLIEFVIKENKNISYYKFLKKVEINNVKITAQVEGINGLVLENDLGLLKADKPFMPFGPTPVAGSNFYIGYEEAFTKQLSKFTLHIEWQNAPVDLITHYADYKYKYYENNTEKEIPYVESKEYFNAHLFVQEGSSLEGKYLNNLFYKEKELKITITIDINDTTNKEKPEFVHTLKPGYIKIQLINSFLHKEYRKLFTEAIVESSKSWWNSKPLTLPNEPYTPVIQSLKLDYEASTSELYFFHLTRYNQDREYGFEKKGLPINLLPHYDNEGEFYIGIAHLEPPQNLSLLFQVAEGTADPEKKVKIQWNYLSHTGWQSIDILSDTTNGMLISGIIVFSIPKEATDRNTILPGEYYWLRAAIEKDTDAVCQLIDVRANAALAQFVDRHNDPEHLRKPLQAGRISKLAEQIGAIKSIEQPYASFGGVMAEDDRAMYTRASERLRHKNRALTIWDFERLVLQNFPSVYKVKCLSHTSLKSWSAPGHVMVVVIPDLRNKNAFNRLEPKVDLNTLEEIKHFLLKHTGCYISEETLHVVNPFYEKVWVDFTVKFHEDADFGYYSERLKQDIVKFLSPWAFEDFEEIAFGGKVHKSVVLNFVEERSYVDYVTSFRMHHSVTGSQDIKVAIASNPRAILVSHEYHNIDKVKDEHREKLRLPCQTT
jgi:hypothetical protein